MEKSLDYFDLHCDTLTCLYDKQETLSNSTCMLKKSDECFFGKCAQVFAVFSKKGLSDEDCYRRFFNVLDYFKTNEGDFCTKSLELKKLAKMNLPIKLLSVEDLRLTCGSKERLYSLLNCGVKIVTPLWSGVTCIGGSFNTDEGLTKQGAELIKTCFEEGITVDISHASRKSTSEILVLAETCGGNVIASHSNSYSVFPHPRNITDNEALRIKNSGGIIGVSAVPCHLTNGLASTEDIVKHILHLLETVGDDSVSLGCDFDGISDTPYDLTCRTDIIKLADSLKSHGIDSKLQSKIFFKNAFNYFTSNLKER